MLGTFFGSSPPPKIVTDSGIIIWNRVFFLVPEVIPEKAVNIDSLNVMFLNFFIFCCNFLAYIQIDTQKYPISGIKSLIHHIPKRNQPTSTISSSFALSFGFGNVQVQLVLCALCLKTKKVHRAGRLRFHPWKTTICHLQQRARMLCGSCSFVWNLGVTLHGEITKYCLGLS